MQKPHNNQELFSNYYLEERLPTRDVWQEPTGLEETYKEISKLYQNRKDILEATKEAQTEEEWIKPILQLLGFKYIPQPSEAIFDTTKVPDYAFFLNDEEKEQAYKAAKDDRKELFDFALAVGDAKRWDLDLNQLRPNKQIDEYLRITGTTWGILTNGRLWRIYHLDSSYRLDTYYEVDLIKLIKPEDDEKFKYFYLFFRPGSFVKDGFLTEVYERSEDYTASISEDLKENAYDALKELCQGFLSGNPKLGEDDLDEIYENSLVLLYRIIFLLYAESDEEEKLMPMDNERYRERYSLKTLKEKTMEQKHQKNTLLSTSHHYWSHLRDLFHFIDQGEESLGVYEYNGGLFDSQKHTFFQNSSIGDKYLAEAIRKVSYSETEGGFIDYQDLDVRELGAIYEGLLEHKPIIDDQQVKWEEDLSERKKTGSYYTPEYIVKYIVENTIGPLVEEKKEELKKDIEELERKKRGSRGYDRDVYERKLKEKRAQVREEILDVKILDPAMGSGHFLVEATEKLANEIASLEEEFSPEEEDQSATVGRETEKTVKELKRQIVERSIYGVDKNPLATELAKLSLWLHTVAKGEPLSFLDHHLRTGDSLIGLEVEEMKTMLSEREQMAGLFTSNLVKDLGSAIGHLNLIEEITSESRDDVQEKKTEWRDVKEWIDKYKQAANVKLSASFGNEVDDRQYRQVLEAAANNNLTQVKNKSFFQRAQIIARDKSFFHWELEFPDVFRNKQGKKKHDGGFDVVIGNPPYISAEFRGKMKKYFKNLMPEVYTGYNDIFYYFYYVGTENLRTGGELGFITSHYFFQNYYAENLRSYLGKELDLKKIVNFSTLKVFPDAGIHTCILIGKKSCNKSSLIDYIIPEGIDFDTASSSKINQEQLDDKRWMLFSNEKNSILNKVKENATELGAIFDIEKGPTTGRNSVFTVDGEVVRKRNLESEIVQPCLKNGDIERYFIENKDRFVIYTDGSKNVRDCKNVFEYLKEHKNELNNRNEVKSGKYPWWRIERPRKGKVFEKEKKIAVPYRAKFNKFAKCDKKYYNDGGDIRVLAPKENSEHLFEPVLAILNSKLGNFIYRMYGKPKGDVYEYFVEPLSKIPIKEVAPKQSNDLTNLTNNIITKKSKLNTLNLNLQDYLGTYSKGKTLGELYSPPQGLSDSIVLKTTSDLDSLRIGKVDFEENNNNLILKSSARYKPVNEENYETDKWGFTETNLIPVMKFSVENTMKLLIRRFVPLAIAKAGGFANFRENATATISLIGRLEKLTLPKVVDVKPGLEKYLDQKEKAKKLKQEIQQTDHQIDAIVFDLYELEEDEVQTVLDSLETPEDEKRDILQKFKTIRG